MERETRHSQFDVTGSQKESVLQTVKFFVRREDYSGMISNGKKELAADDVGWADFRGLTSALTANIRARSQRTERPAVYFIFLVPATPG